MIKKTIALILTTISSFGATNVTIDLLTEATLPTNADIFLGMQGGLTKKFGFSNIQHSVRYNTSNEFFRVTNKTHLTKVQLPTNSVILVTGHSWANGYHAGVTRSNFLLWFTNYYCDNYVYLTNQSREGATFTNVFAWTNYTAQIQPYITNAATNFFIIDITGANECFNAVTNWISCYNIVSNYVKAVITTNHATLIMSTIPGGHMAYNSIGVPNEYFRTNWNRALWMLSEEYSPHLRIADLDRELNPYNIPLEDIAEPNLVDNIVSLYPGQENMRRIARIIANLLREDYGR